MYSRDMMTLKDDTAMTATWKTWRQRWQVMKATDMTWRSQDKQARVKCGGLRCVSMRIRRNQ